MAAICHNHASAYKFIYRAQGQDTTKLFGEEREVLLSAQVHHAVNEYIHYILELIFILLFI